VSLETAPAWSRSEPAHTIWRKMTRCHTYAHRRAHGAASSLACRPVTRLMLRSNTCDTDYTAVEYAATARPRQHTRARVDDGMRTRPTQQGGSARPCPAPLVVTACGGMRTARARRGWAPCAPATASAASPARPARRARPCGCRSAQRPAKSPAGRPCSARAAPAPPRQREMRTGASCNGATLTELHGRRPALRPMRSAGARPCVSKGR